MTSGSPMESPGHRRRPALLGQTGLHPALSRPPTENEHQSVKGVSDLSADRTSYAAAPLKSYRDQLQCSVDPYATVRSSKSTGSRASLSAKGRLSSPTSSPQIWRNSRLISNETLVDSLNSGQDSPLCDNHRWSIWTSNSSLMSDLAEESLNVDSLVSQPLRERFDMTEACGTSSGAPLRLPTEGDDDDETDNLTSTSRRSSSTSSRAFTPDSSGCAFSASDRSSVMPKGTIVGTQRSEQTPASAEGRPTDFTRSASDIALDAVLASTMLALEKANSLLLSTMSGRAQIAKLRASESELDSLMEQKERDLQRLLDQNRSMSQTMEKVNAELDSFLTSTAPQSSATRLGSGWRVQGPAVPSSDVHFHSTQLEGIVEAQDKGATVSKSAAKRLERVLSTRSQSPKDVLPPQKSRADAKTLLSSLVNITSSSGESARPPEIPSNRRPSLNKASTTTTLDTVDHADVTSSNSSLSNPPLPSESKPTSSTTPVIDPSEKVLKTRRSIGTLGPHTPRPMQAPARSASALLVPTQASVPARSSLSDAFGLGAVSKTGQVSSETPLEKCEEGFATPQSMLTKTPVQSETSPSFLHKRTPSALHSRTASVIKPSTIASSEWTAYHALASPNIRDSDHALWSTPGSRNMSTERSAISAAQGRGALAALKLLNQQTAAAGTSDKLEAASGSAHPPLGRTASSTSNSGAAAGTSEDGAPLNSSAAASEASSPWTFASWMGFSQSRSNSETPDDLSSDIQSGLSP